MNFKRRSTWVVTILVMAVVGSGGLWRLHIARQDRQLREHSTRFFQWGRGDTRGEWTLTVRSNPELRKLVSTPSVPFEGAILVVGEPGTVEVGTVVLVQNTRSGQSVGATADKAGAFGFKLDAKAGDDFKVFAMKPPKIIESPAPEMYGQQSTR